MTPSSINPDEIKHILFDLGGVLLNIDYNQTIDAFKKLGIVDFDAIYSQSKQSGLFNDFEKGLISEDAFIWELSQKIPKGVKEEQVVMAWNAMLLNFPADRVSLLTRLKDRYNLFLFSNTNEIHFNSFNGMFKNSYDFAFSNLFKKDYYSHLIGMRKPDHESFNYILTEENINAQEILFIDDSEQHVESAQKLGINAVLLKKGTEIEDLLAFIGILT